MIFIRKNERKIRVRSGTELEQNKEDLEFGTFIKESRDCVLNFTKIATKYFRQTKNQGHDVLKRRYSPKIYASKLFVYVSDHHQLS